MAGNTVKDLNDTLSAFINELTVITNSVKLSLESGSRNVGSLDLTMKKDIREFKENADSYDRQFEEEEARLQAYGGKSRKQTLQEFVLLFFCVSYGILTVALLLFAHKAGLNILKIAGLMAFIFLILVSLIITYA